MRPLRSLLPGKQYCFEGTERQDLKRTFKAYTLQSNYQSISSEATCSTGGVQ